MRVLQLLSLPGLALGTFLAVLAGCQSADSASAPDQAPPSPAETASLSPEEAKIEAALAKLSEEDRKLAISQKICPVSDARLGSMEGLTKVQVKGRDVFICCSGCEEFLKAEPDKYLAKLAPAAADTATK